MHTCIHDVTEGFSEIRPPPVQSLSLDGNKLRALPGAGKGTYLTGPVYFMSILYMSLFCEESLFPACGENKYCSRVWVHHVSIHTCVWKSIRACVYLCISMWLDCQARDLFCMNVFYVPVCVYVCVSVCGWIVQHVIFLACMCFM
jgi:hypothetical protein